MDDKNLAQLANMVTVRNHTYSLMNGPTGVAMTGFGKEDTRRLKRIIAQLDKDFIDGVVVLDPAAVQKTLPQELEPAPEQDLNIVDVIDPKDMLAPIGKPRKISKAKKKAKKKSSKKTAKKASADPDIAKRIKEEKAALASKNG